MLWLKDNRFYLCEIYCFNENHDFLGCELWYSKSEDCDILYL